MDTDRITGTAKETVGKAEAAVGNVTGDHETEASGRVRQATGAAQDIYGQARIRWATRSRTRPSRPRRCSRRPAMPSSR